MRDDLQISFSAMTHHSNMYCTAVCVYCVCMDVFRGTCACLVCILNPFTTPSSKDFIHFEEDIWKYTNIIIRSKCKTYLNKNAEKSLFLALFFKTSYIFLNYGWDENKSVNYRLFHNRIDTGTFCWAGDKTLKELYLKLSLNYVQYMYMVAFNAQWQIY